MILTKLPLPGSLIAVLPEPGFLKAICPRLRLRTVPLLKPGHRRAVHPMLLPRKTKAVFQRPVHQKHQPRKTHLRKLRHWRAAHPTLLPRKTKAVLPKQQNRRAVLLRSRLPNLKFLWWRIPKRRKKRKRKGGLCWLSGLLF